MSIQKKKAVTHSQKVQMQTTDKNGTKAYFNTLKDSITGQALAAIGHI